MSNHPPIVYGNAGLVFGELCERLQECDITMSREGRVFTYRATRTYRGKRFTQMKQIDAPQFAYSDFHPSDVGRLVANIIGVSFDIAIREMEDPQGIKITEGP